MKQNIIILLCFLIAQISLAQEKVERRKILERYANGQTMKEYVKYQGKDTLLEFIYFENGQVNYKSQFFNNQRNGWSFTYNENGGLVFHENYVNGKFSGQIKSYHPSGKISRIEYYENNRHIDTSTFFDESGQVLKTVEFINPCELASGKCNQIVSIFTKGLKVYSYKVNQGNTSDKHDVYDQELYDEVLAKENQISLSDKGKILLQSKCGMCHKLNKPIIGPALSCITKTKSEEDLKNIVNGENEHPINQLTDEEIKALIAYIDKNCP